jgi:hypothetical protein
VTFVPPQTHRSNLAERAVRTGKNHLISVFSSTHPDFPEDLWDRLLPYAEITLNVLRPWRPDPTLSAWSGLHHLPYDFSTHPLHLPGQLCLAFSGPDHRGTWASHGDRAFTLGPALTHYCCQRVFPLPLFHFAASDLPSPPTPDPSATRPSPTLDGTDLIGRVFNDPDLGLCRVVKVGPPHRLAPGEGNLDPTGLHLQAGWVPTLRYNSLGGTTHTSSVTEVAEWVRQKKDKFQFYCGMARLWNYGARTLPSWHPHPMPFALTPFPITATSSPSSVQSPRCSPQ